MANMVINANGQHLALHQYPCSQVPTVTVTFTVYFIVHKIRILTVLSALESQFPKKNILEELIHCVHFVFQQ